MNIPWKRYIAALVVTIGLFVFAFLLSAQFSNTKINELREIQDKIAVDILASETRFALLETSSCQHVVTSDAFDTTLNNELNRLARRLKFMESQFGGNSEEVLTVRKQYALLQVKDYLLVRQLAERCDKEVFTILYFHEADCSSCERQTLVLDELRNEFPGVRIYWMDKDLDTPTTQTLLSMFNINEAPTLIVDGTETIEGFIELDKLREMVPEWVLSQEELNEAEVAARATTAEADTATAVTEEGE